MDNKLKQANQKLEVVGKAFVISAQQDQNIKQAAERIKQGKLVSFPTETVYGLGANALDPNAAIKIFHAKGIFQLSVQFSIERPLTDPLILHVCSTQSALKLVSISSKIQQFFQFVTNKLWPGPLTVVMRANDKVIDPLLTAGTGYVGIRRPSHPVSSYFIQLANVYQIASKLIQYSELPIAAPSANKFGHVSPTKPQHVLKDFTNNDVLILNGGNSTVGIQSTVIKLIQTDDNFIKIFLLRRGGISQQMLRQLLNESQQYKSVQIITQDIKSHNKQIENQQAPGQFLRHYAPNIDSYIFVNEANPHLILQYSQVCQNTEESEKYEDLKQEEKINLNLSKSVLIDFGGRYQQFKSLFKAYVDLSEEGNYKEAMLNLYDYLRWAETYQDADKVLITQLTKTEDSHQNQHFDALFDKVFRATSGRKIELHHQDISVGKLVYLAK